MPANPNAPVLVGVGQAIHRPGDDGVASPLGLMTAAARAAIDDAGAPAGEALLASLDSLAVIEAFSWPVPDPAALVAAELGAAPAETVRAITGGNAPVAALADLAAAIQAGRSDVALITGAEALTPLMAAMREGRATGWPQQPDGTAPSRVIGAQRGASHPAEQAVGLIAPVAYYPFLESAVRGGSGRSPEDHQRRLGDLWARVGAAAAENPYAWTRDVPPPEALATPGDGNRRVTIPYTKLLNANIQVDQGAALLLCSAQAAHDAGVPRDRWVFVAATAGAHDHWFVSERDRLDRSPAIAACGRAALGHAGLGIDEVAHLDLYSCFPSAVQIAAGALGIDLEADARAPSVTGGLTFAGGPGSNYVTHSLATLAGRIRADPSAHALATGLGWYVTKHGVAVLSGEPPARPFAHHDVQAEVDALPSREVADDAAGAVVPIEAYTGFYERDGTLSVVIAGALLPDGRRTLAKADDPELLAHAAEHDLLRRDIRLAPDHRFALAG